MTEANSGERPVETRTTLPEVLGVYVLPNVELYKRLLEQEAVNEARNADLGASTQARLAAFQAELDALAKISEDAIAQKPFTPVVQTHKVLDGTTPHETFTLRIAPKDEKLPLGGDRPQNQLGFHVNVAAGGEEHIDVLRALSLKGRDPHRVLDAYFKQTTEQLVIVNTVGVYIDDMTRGIRINPQAGIAFRWRSGEDSAKVNGLVYVGDNPHFMELPGEMPRPKFAAFQNMIASSVGKTRQSPIQRR